MRSRSAARPKCSSSATATKYRSWRSSTAPGYFLWKEIPISETKPVVDRRRRDRGGWR